VSFKVLALVQITFLVTAVDLLPVHDRNRIIKIADDIISSYRLATELGYMSG